MDAFVNCPFDDEYIILLRVIIFTLLVHDIEPRLTLEDSDSGVNRLEKIVKLMEESDISIHDLSRIQSTKTKEYFRLNMPFELGIDYGIKITNKKIRKFLVLEGDKYSYQKGLSDYSGMDIWSHEEQPEKLVKIIRDWLVNNKLTKLRLGGSAIWYHYNDCRAYIYDILLERGYSKKETNTIPLNEYKELVRIWLKSEIK